MLQTSPLEAECKFRVPNADGLVAALGKLNATFVGSESHRDTYLRHPARDFRQTDEALRIREINGNPYITYKGPRLAGPIKIRPEIELSLVQGTVESWLQIWTNLGFEIAASVEKVRGIYEVEHLGRSLTVTIDSVKDLGDFAEIERIIQTSEAVDQAQEDILSLAEKLGLTQVEKKSYLGLLLQLRQRERT